MAFKLHNRRWYPFAFLIGVAAVFMVWICFVKRTPVEQQKPELLLTAIGGFAAWTYFLYRQHLDQTKLFKDLFTEFNARYDELNDNLNAILHDPLNGELTESERELLFDYFNLCSEEHLFHKAGYIDENVWESWRKGMKVFFDHPRIRLLWNAEGVSGSYYGFSPD